MLDFGSTSWEYFDVANTTNLELRGRTWWAYRTVPPSLRTMVGKRNLRRSLETSDLAEAIRRKPAAMAEFAEILEQARTSSGSRDPAELGARRWHQFESQIVRQPEANLSAEDRAHLFITERLKIEAQFGPDAGQRFEQMASKPAGERVDAHLTAFHAQTRTAPKTKAEQATAIRRLIAWDPSLNLRTLDRRAAGRYVSDGLTFTQSPVTKNKQITCLSAYWRWLLRKGIVDENPWREQFLPIRGHTDTQDERPFTDAEITTLLANAVDARLADAMRIAALSGMRIEEICLLRVADCADGLFNIRKAKTQAGVRVVPIHSGLTQMIHARCRGKRPEDFLLHELGPTPTTGAIRARSDPLSKQFTRYRREIGVDALASGHRRSLVNFHSFRRWFITKAEHAGIPPWTIESVVGHKRSGMTLGVYSEGSSVEQLRACVEAITEIVCCPPTI